jgi:hypothetical protein
MNPRTDDSISWDVDIPLATNPVILMDLLKALGGGLLLVFIILAVASLSEGNLEAILNAFKISVILLVVFIVLAWVIMWIFFGNKFHARFTVTRKGTSYETFDKRAKTASRLAIIAGTLLGKPVVAGSGLLAMSQESMFLKWKGVFKTTFDDKRKTIALRNTWRKIIVIYCTKDNYDKVSEFVKTQMNSRGSLPTAKSPLPGTFLYSVLIILACVPLFLLSQWPFEINLFIPIFILAFALATILFVPLFGFIVIVGVAVLIGMIFYNQISGYGFSLDQQEWIGLILAFIGMTFLVWFSIQALKLRIPSLLMSDVEDMD